MILFLLMAAGIWALGRVMDAPSQARWLMLGLLYVGFLAVQVVAPEGSGLDRATSPSVAGWLILGVLLGGAFLYRRWLKGLREQAAAKEEAQAEEARAATVPSGPFTDAELDRYARHIVLREIGGTGQRRLKEARVLVVGAGGLGAPALLYLAGAGVGTLGVIDHDRVDVSNLQRQVIHRDRDGGDPKVASAMRAVKALNPGVDLRPYDRRLTEEIAADLVADYDLVLDGTDDWDTRWAVNAACVARGVPLIAGAIAQWEGQVGLYAPHLGGPCTACLFPAEPDPGTALTCAEGGVLGPLPGIVGSIMAAEAVKHVTGAGETLLGRLMLFDALHMEARTIQAAPREDCPVCRGAGLRRAGTTA